MNFPENLEFFIGCDPDTKHAAYACVDLEGNLIEAWTVESDGTVLGQVKAHDKTPFPYKARCQTTHGSIIVSIEGQQVYKDDKKSNPSDLIKLARSSGISAYYLSEFCPTSIEVVLPSEWKGTKQKHAHQAQILNRLKQAAVIKGSGDSRYAVPKENFLNMNMTQYKHVIDAIGIALWLRDQYVWECKKNKSHSEFKEKNQT